MVYCSSSRSVPYSPSGSGGVEKIQIHRTPMAGVLFLCLMAVLLITTLPVYAQQSTGAIVGTVVDPTGAAVEGVTVTAKDVDRGTVLTTLCFLTIQDRLFGENA